MERTKSGRSVVKILACGANEGVAQNKMHQFAHVIRRGARGGSIQILPPGTTFSREWNVVDRRRRSAR
jgi:hypothetical protein